MSLDAMILDAIGDALNRAVLLQVKTGPLAPGDLLEQLHMSRSSLQRRVRILDRCGLLTRDQGAIKLAPEALQLMIAAVRHLAP